MIKLENSIQKIQYNIEFLTNQLQELNQELVLILGRQHRFLIDLNFEIEILNFSTKEINEEVKKEIIDLESEIKKLGVKGIHL